MLSFRVLEATPTNQSALVIFCRWSLETERARLLDYSAIWKGHDVARELGTQWALPAQNSGHEDPYPNYDVALFRHRCAPNNRGLPQWAYAN